MLLRHGANPDLRDEDGKTPLDKARERNDEGHREVVQILQSPGISTWIFLIDRKHILKRSLQKCCVKLGLISLMSKE